MEERRIRHDLENQQEEADTIIAQQVLICAEESQKADYDLSALGDMNAPFDSHQPSHCPHISLLPHSEEQHVTYTTSGLGEKERERTCVSSKPCCTTTYQGIIH